MPKIFQYLVGNRDVTGYSQGDSHGYIALLEPQRTSSWQRGMQMLQAVGVGSLLGVWGGTRTTSPNIHELDGGT